MANALPDLTATLSPTLKLPTPILAASGTFGFGPEIADIANIGRIGALITPTLTKEPLRGNPMPRTAEVTAGLLHTTGLPNPGIEAFKRETLPRMGAMACPLIVNIAAETPDDWAELASALTVDGGPIALELNLTPFPLLLAERTWEPHPTESTLLETIGESIAAVRAATSLPLIAKLPSVGADIGSAAQVAATSGADMISVSQAFPGIAVRTGDRSFRFPGVVGGLSGPCIKPMALYQVWRATRAVALPVIGMGGIVTADDALEYFLTGASAVALGVANLIHPNAIATLTDELTGYLVKHGFGSYRELIAAAQRG